MRMPFSLLNVLSKCAPCSCSCSLSNLIICKRKVVSALMGVICGQRNSFEAAAEGWPSIVSTRPRCWKSLMLMLMLCHMAAVWLTLRETEIKFTAIKWSRCLYMLWQTKQKHQKEHRKRTKMVKNMWQIWKLQFSGSSLLFLILINDKHKLQEEI